MGQRGGQKKEKKLIFKEKIEEIGERWEGKLKEVGCGECRDGGDAGRTRRTAPAPVGLRSHRRRDRKRERTPRDAGPGERPQKSLQHVGSSEEL